MSLADAQRAIKARRIEYNTARPYPNLDGRTPQESVEGLNLVQLHPTPDDR